MIFFREKTASLAVLLAFACALSHAEPANASALSSFPDFLSVRSEFLSAVVTAPAATAQSFRTAYRDTGAGRVRVSVERDGQSLYVLFLRERDGGYPYGSRGNIIVKRDASTNFMRQIKWILSDDGLSWISLTPRNERTIVDYVVGGSVVRSGLAVSNLLYYFFMQPFKYLHDMTRNTLDWTLVLGPAGDGAAAELADQLDDASGTGRASPAASSLIRAAMVLGQKNAAPYADSSASPQEEVTTPAFASVSSLADERDSGPFKTVEYNPEKGLPIAAATATMMAGMGEGTVYIGRVDGSDGRYAYKLVLVPYRTASGSYELFAFDAEAKKPVAWGELVRSRADGFIRLVGLPAPRN